MQLCDGGIAPQGVWSDSRILSSPHIYHCFTLARWRKNDLCDDHGARSFPYESIFDMFY